MFAGHDCNASAVSHSLSVCASHVTFRINEHFDSNWLDVKGHLRIQIGNLYSPTMVRRISLTARRFPISQAKCRAWTEMCPVRLAAMLKFETCLCAQSPSELGVCPKSPSFWPGSVPVPSHERLLAHDLSLFDVGLPVPISSIASIIPIWWYLVESILIHAALSFHSNMKRTGLQTHQIWSLACTCVVRARSGRLISPSMTLQFL